MTKNIENSAFVIAPMVLIVFLENAFKHGIGKMEEYCKVNVTIETSRGGFFLGLKNNYSGDQKSEPGVGLMNVKRRLDLIYPKTHTLDIVDDGVCFDVTLKINEEV